MDLGRVVLVGDAGAGKTSLAHALAGAALPDVLPRVVAPLPAPVAVRAACPVRRCPVLASPESPESAVDAAREPAHLTVVDTAPETAEAALRGAAVVCVVCNSAAPRAAVLDTLAARWLPLAAAAAPHAPVLVVFAQMDRVRDAAALTAALDGVLAAHAAVCGGHACATAAPAPRGVDALRARAAEEALFPLAPLCDAATGAPTPALRHALARVFALLDTAGTGALGPDALACLGRGSRSSSSSSSVDYAGFVRLVAQMLRRLRHAPVWRLLRRAGYTRDLTLALPPPGPDNSSGSSEEGGARFVLTEAAAAFLRTVEEGGRERVAALLAGRVPELCGAADLGAGVRALCSRAPQTAVEALWLLGYGFADAAPDVGVRSVCLPVPPAAAATLAAKRSSSVPLGRAVAAAGALVPALGRQLWARARGFVGSTRFWALVAAAVAAVALGRPLSGLFRATPPRLLQQQQQQQQQSRVPAAQRVALLLFPHGDTQQPLPWYLRVKRFFS